MNKSVKKAQINDDSQLKISLNRIPRLKNLIFRGGTNEESKLKKKKSLFTTVCTIDKIVHPSMNKILKLQKKMLLLKVNLSETDNKPFLRYLLSRTLQHLKTTKQISIKLQECDHTANALLDKLRAKLPTLYSLNFIDLKFDHCITPIKWNKLCHMYSKMSHNIEYMNLDFEGCNMLTDVALQKLGKHLGNNVFGPTKLKQLLIKMGSVGPQKIISDTGLRHLCNGVCQLGTSLKALLIQLPGSLMISDNGLAVIKDLLPQLPNLEFLDINLYRCLNIGNIGLVSLSMGLPALKQLKELHLNFAKNKHIDDEGIKTLLTNLTFLQNTINSINLVLYDCTGLSRDIKIQLHQSELPLALLL